MSDQALQFQRLQLRRMYGRAFDLSLDDLGPGVNVVVGPNASGKSTLARGMAALIWPNGDHDDRPTANGAFRLDGTLWRVEVDGSRTTVQGGDGSTRPGALPPSTHRNRYALRLHDLLGAGDDSEQDFAEAILQEAQGGHDVAGAADRLNFGDRAKGKLSLTGDVEAARDRVREARKKQQEILEKQNSLDGVQDALNAAQEAAARRDALEQALDVNEAETKLQAAKQERAEFPDGMDAVRPDDAERLKSLREERSEQVGKKDAAETEREDAQQVLQNSSLPDDGLPSGTLERLEETVDAWAEKQREVDAARKEVAKAAETEADEWRRLSGQDKDAVAALDAPDVDAVQSLAEDGLALKGREKALDALERVFGNTDADTDAGVDADALQRGIRWLEEWLREPDPDAVPGGMTIKHTAGIVVGLVVAGVGAYLFIGGALLGLALVVLGGVALALFVVTGRAGPDVKSNREEVAARFGRLPVDPPRTWAEADVQKRLDALVDEWTSARLAKARSDEWARHAEDVDQLQADRTAHDREHNELADRLSVEPSWREHALSWFVQRLSAWQDAYARVNANEAALQEAKHQAGTHADAVRDLVAPYGIDDVDDVPAGKAALSRLRTEQGDHADARRTRDAATSKIEDADERIRAIDEALGDLFERIGVESGNDAAVEARCDALGDYEDAVDAVRRARTSAENETDRLKTMDGFEPSMLEADVQALRRARDEAAQTAGEADALAKEIAQIEQQVNDAKEQHDLEDALAALENERAALRDRFESDVRSVAGQALATVVHRQTRNQDLPEVFHRADELFRSITRDRFRLHLDRAGMTFRAETDAGDKLPLDALSSGTKVQLLLAVRIAFVETQERGVRLPLILDETLANSDDARAHAIIDAVQAICARGRQIFYLTAQRDEVAKWETTLRGSDVPLDVHALGDDVPVLDVKDSSGDGAVRLPETPSVPDPSDTSHDELEALLDVPRWTPRMPVAHLSLWYLTDDAALLCRAAEASYLRWGQVEGLAERGGLDLVGLSEDGFRALDALARAVDAWRSAWKVGRGAPVDRAALEATDAVSDTFLDAVTDLAERENGDAGRILDGLRAGDVKNFRSSKIEQLEGYFLDEGYLTLEDTLSDEACLRRAFGAVASEIDTGTVTKPDVRTVLRRIVDRMNEDAHVPTSS